MTPPLSQTPLLDVKQAQSSHTQDTQLVVVCNLGLSPMHHQGASAALARASCGGLGGGCEDESQGHTHTDGIME